MIKAAIFDMDGLLIESEPLWGRARDEVLDEVGVKLRLEDIYHVRGQGLHNAVEYWYHRHPWRGKTKAEVEDAITEKFLEILKTKGKLLPGVHHTIEICKQAGLPTAIASSSPMKVINAVVDQMEIRDLFDEIYSGRNEPHSKPHPGVFITVAQMFDVSPLNCLVFEDAPSGVLAAKAARMKCIAVPDSDVKDHAFIQTADRVLGSLEEFSPTMLAKL